MEIIKSSAAGTMESSDIMVTIEPGSGDIQIELKSMVENQFGRQIRSVIAGTLAELQVKNAKVTAVDMGALDCTIQARIKTAAFRAAEKDMKEWRAPK